MQFPTIYLIDRSGVSPVPDQPERPKTPKEERAERSAAALRANLRRRKEQQAQRHSDAPPESEGEGE